MKGTDQHRRDEHGGVHVELSPRLVDRDVDLRAVGYTVFGVLALTIVAALLMWWLLAAFLSGAEAADPRPGPAMAAAPRELPPGPRLQARPQVDYRRLRAREERILASYGWTEEGGLRIPIERAMDALAAGAAAVDAGGDEEAAVAGAADAGAADVRATDPRGAEARDADTGAVDGARPQPAVEPAAVAAPPPDAAPPSASAAGAAADRGDDGGR